jgi:hypothetical protein
MRLALLVLAAIGVLVLWRRRGSTTARVVVAWPDGDEVALREGPEHERLVAVAARALG